MVRTTALLFALVVVSGAIGYSQNMRRFEATNFKDPRAAAGQVNLDGSVGQGTHFTASRVGSGEYELTFSERYFVDGCPIVTITPANLSVTFRVLQSRCNVYYVYFTALDGNPRDSAFDLIAVATE